MMMDTNTLDFEMFDPEEAGEEWALTWGSDHKAVEVYIDGKKLLDIIREIEVPYAEEEGNPELAGSYGHVSPESLYIDLCRTSLEEDPNEQKSYYDGRVYLFCCRDCGEVFCWTVSFRVKEDEEFVYWYDFRNMHRWWGYNLTFKFEKEDYQEAIWELWDLFEKLER